MSRIDTFMFKKKTAPLLLIVSLIALMLLQFQPAFAAGPAAVDGRILTPDMTGDSCNWVEIAQDGAYSLIVRSNYINIYTQANRYGDPIWQYTAFGSTGAYSSSNVRNRINEWFNGAGPSAADNLPANARLRSYTVLHNALSMLGTCSNPNASLTDGLSKPTTNKAGNGDDIAFALSYSESANYCSLSHFMRQKNPAIQPSSAIAVANYKKIAIPDIYSYGMWLRSPGDVSGTAGALANSKDSGRVFQMQLSPGAGSERGLVYPALWVDAEIFGAASTVSLTYDANGGAGAPPAQTDIPLDTYATISSTIPTRSDNATFLGWALSSTATTAQYQPGGAIHMNSDITLFAVWQQSSGEGGRILTPDKTGDIVNWLEIAREGNYSLIVRTSYINIYTQASRYGDPTWQYTAFGSTSAYSSSNVRNRINEWFNGTAPAAADNLSASARLRGFTVLHNALSMLGTCSNPNASLTDGLSKPTANKAGNGDDIAFALSYSESANYCSLTHFMRLMDPAIQPSSAIAVANYKKIAIPDIYSYGMWLRSPGDVSGTAGALANSKDSGRVFQMQLSPGAGSERGLVYPALWVDSEIFGTNTGTIYVIHTDADAGELIKEESYSVSAGPYGPYDADDIPGYAYSGLATDSDLPQGTIAAGETKIIIHQYTAVRTISGLVKPMATNDLFGIGNDFLQQFDVVVELRPTFLTPAPPELSTKAELLDLSGLGQFVIENVPFGDYVLYIKRPGYLARPMLITVDASTPLVIELAPPGTADNGIFNLWGGDCNDDLLIDNLDFIMILDLMNEHVNALDKRYLPDCDLNADGLIDTKDFNIAFENWGKNILDYPGAQGVDPFE